jgi:hypothetical protein
VGGAGTESDNVTYRESCGHAPLVILISTTYSSSSICKLMKGFIKKGKKCHKLRYSKQLDKADERIDI